MEAVETLLEGWAVRDIYPWKPPPSTLGLRCDLDSSPKQTAKVLSFLTPDECKKGGGSPGVAVLGIFTDPDSTVAGFRVNRVVVEFMHTAIRTVGPSDPSLLEAAAQRGSGWLYIIDLRTPEGPQGRVPAEDIVDGFEGRDGTLLAESYHPKKHRVLTQNGPRPAASVVTFSTSAGCAGTS